MDEAEWTRFVKSAEWTVHLPQAQRTKLSKKRNSRKRYWAADGKVADASKARKQAARDEEREAQAVHGLAAMQQGGNQ